MVVHEACLGAAEESQVSKDGARVTSRVAKKAAMQKCLELPVLQSVGGHGNQAGGQCLFVHSS